MALSLLEPWLLGCMRCCTGVLPAARRRAVCMPLKKAALARQVRRAPYVSAGSVLAACAAAAASGRGGFCWQALRQAVGVARHARKRTGHGSCVSRLAGAAASGAARRRALRQFCCVLPYWRRQRKSSLP
ncbi:hypothetical protein NPIL_576781 [Nephila pilipes]|uniref:Uncharacterized protein n=1 Tax=Nephila pilipes TaxID=299642 RepID=A0A8X6MXD4_NEPPI|nr:hypothetical protein NPIL_576781 [Nephila pilipes]